MIYNEVLTSITQILLKYTVIDCMSINFTFQNTVIITV